MESSVPSGKSKTEPPPHRWGEVCGSAIAILTLILPAAAIVQYSPASSVQALPTIPSQSLPSVSLPIDTGATQGNAQIPVTNTATTE